MPLPGLLFPQTALGRATYLSLWPLVQPLMVLEPPGLPAPLADPAWAAPGSLTRLRPPLPRGLDPKALEALRRSWEQWLVGRQGSLEAEALKAGLALPPEPETFRSLKAELLGGTTQAAQPTHPHAQAGLFLALLHRQDQDAADMEDLLAKAQAAQLGLTQALGQYQEDYQPTGYEQPFGGRLRPRDTWAEPEDTLSRRLAAWGSLAASAPISDPAWLVSVNLAACQLLMERAGEGRAQEVCQLTLPSLAALSASDLAAAALDGLEQTRAALAALLSRLAAEPWTPALKDAVAAQAQDLALDLADAQAQALPEHDLPSQGLSILAFPGLTLAQVLAIMQGQDPGPAQAAGSCPVLAAW